MTIIRAMRLGLAAPVLVAMAACSGTFDIPNTDRPAAGGVPTRGTLARSATGIFSQLTTNVAGQIQQWGIYGREGYNLLGNDPRETGEEIRGPQDPGGRAGGQWLGPYAAIRSIFTYLDGVAAVSSAELSAAEKSASSGFGKTMLAFHFLNLAVRSGPTGFPIDVNKPIADPPAPFVTQVQGYAEVMRLLNEGAAELAAGGSSFPFTLPSSFAGFTTPAKIREFNRALAARASVDRATMGGCGAPCWQDALNALGESFLTTSGLPGSLATGVFYFYSTVSGEPTNPITEPLSSNRYWVHPSIQAMAQLKANLQPDDRFTAKVRDAGRTRVLNNISSSIKPILYNTNTATSSVANLAAFIPLIKNEELILLRAEANLALGNTQLALDDINLIRVNSGGLLPSTLTVASPPDDILTELLYNRLMSLLWEQGTRWLDARKYGRIASLPLDRAGDVVHQFMLVPAAECDARGLPTPCQP